MSPGDRGGEFGAYADSELSLRGLNRGLDGSVNGGAGDEREMQGVQEAQMWQMWMVWEAQDWHCARLPALWPRHYCACCDASRRVLLARGQFGQAQAL